MANPGQAPHEFFDVTIESGSKISASASLHGYTVVGFSVPTGFEGSALTFLAATRSISEFQPVMDYSQSATRVSVYVTAGARTDIPPTLLPSVQTIKLESDVVTTEDRVITIIARPI